MNDLNKNLDQEYEDILNEYNLVNKEVEHLKDNDIIKKYFELQKKLEELSSKERNLYKKKLINKYRNCNHIYVTSGYWHDDYEGRSYRYSGCIKCGLDEAITLRGAGRDKEEEITLEIIKQYSDYVFHGGIDINLNCDLDDAREIYDELSKENPGIDDESMIYLFKKRVKEMKENRRKRII